MTGNDVLVITGPTATGKTELGVALAESLGGEVVSADSMQVYKYMDIGTAKPSEDEMRGIPHHMLSVVSPFEKYSVSQYVEGASRCVDDILSRGKVPVIVGGTGLYIESLILGRDFAGSGADPALREKLSAEYDALGGEKMLEKLREYDPKRAEKLHPNDKKRIIRALESAEGGLTITEHDAKTRLNPPRYNVKIIVLGFEERSVLYGRIDRRVDAMMERGLVGEVRSLLQMGLTAEHTAMQAIGYKELVQAFGGGISLDAAVEDIKRGSRRYAKRQTSWCARYENALRINWKNSPDIDSGIRDSTFFWNER